MSVPKIYNKEQTAGSTQEQEVNVEPSKYAQKPMREVTVSLSTFVLKLHNYVGQKLLFWKEKPGIFAWTIQ